MRSNYITFPFRIIEKRRRKGKRRDCQCVACRKKSLVNVAKAPLRKIRIVHKN